MVDITHNIGTHLFVKVPRPGQQNDHFGLRVKLPPVFPV